MDTERMLFALSEGKELSPDEVAQLIEVLDAAGNPGVLGSSVDDVYECLLVLGKAKLSIHRRTLEQFLRAEDPLTVALVLEILCLQWECTDDYLEQVISFALGVPWDFDEDVKQTALKILGEYLYNHSKRGAAITPQQQTKRGRVLDLLFTMFCDEEAQQWVRQTAYYALCRAAGKEWDELPPECMALDLSAGSKDLDNSVLEFVNQVLSSSNESSSSNPSRG